MGEHVFSRRRIKRLLATGVATASLAGGSLAATAPPAVAVTSNMAYACGYWSNVSLFGGPYGSQGCAPQTSGYATANSLSPSVTLSASGSATQISDSDGAKAVYGPAVIFSSPYDANDNTYNSGRLYVYTAGTSTVYGIAEARAVGPSPFWTKTPTSWQPSSDGTVGFVYARCSASSPTNKSSYVRIKNGVVDTSTDADGYPTSQYLVPEYPTAGLRVDFTIDNVGDRGHMKFHEVVNRPDYSVEVNGSNMYMEGPTALGNVKIAQTQCGHV